MNILKVEDYHKRSDIWMAVVQLLSRVQLCYLMDCSTLDFPVLIWMIGVSERVKLSKDTKQILNIMMQSFL